MTRAIQVLKAKIHLCSQAEIYYAKEISKHAIPPEGLINDRSENLRTQESCLAAINHLANLK